MSISGETPDQVAVDEADELRADIVDARAELADTIDQLVAKADVKGRARRQVNDVVQRAQPYRKQLAAAGAGLLAVLVVLMVRRH